MDPLLRQRYQLLITALNTVPAPQDWAGHYDDDALLVKPTGELLRGRAAIEAFLVGDGLRPIEAELLQAEQVGASGYTVATFKIGSQPPVTGTSFTLYTGAGGAARIIADVYGGALLPKALDEWKECRTSIDRFDKLIADVRKYGFTLITGLLTAGAFAFVKLDSVSVPDAVRVGASVVLMVLVFGLFTVDRSLEVFLRAAVMRARQLEGALDLRLTGMISSVAEGARTSTWATWLYTLFMLSAVVPWLVSTSPWRSPIDIAISPGPPRAITIIGLGFTALVWVYHYRTRLGLPQD